MGNLTVTVSSATVTLGWSATSTVTGFIIQHSLAPMGNFSTIASATVSAVSYVKTYSNPDDQQINHYFRVIGKKSASSYTLPSNVVIATPNKAGKENIYKYVINQIISTLKNDSRLAIVEEWKEARPDKCMTFRRVTGWVFFTGEIFNDWVALGERELQLGVHIGFNIKEPTNFDRWNSNSVTEPKELLFQLKEVLYDYNDLSDYCYDMEIRDEAIVPNFDGAVAAVVVSTVWKKRIRR